MAWDRVRVAGFEGFLLAGDGEDDGTLQDEAKLLVLVMVLGHDAVGRQVDDGERHPLSVDDSGLDVVPDLVRPELGQRPECLTQLRGRLWSPCRGRRRSTSFPGRSFRPAARPHGP